MLEFICGVLVGVLGVVLAVLFVIYYLFLSPNGPRSREYTSSQPKRGLSFQVVKNKQKEEEKEKEKGSVERISEHFKTHKESSEWLNSILHKLFISQLPFLKVLLKTTVDTKLEELNRMTIVPGKLRLVFITLFD